MARRILDAFGMDPVATLHAFRGSWPYLRDYFDFVSANRRDPTGFCMSTPFPCLSDRYAQSGTAQGAYFHQDLLVAQRIHENNPRRHIDVGSSVAGFVAHVASYREIEVIDVRPLAGGVRNMRFRQLDLMSDLPQEYAGCCDSLSCLHALEHFGLGRYGDPVRPGGHMLGWGNLHRMLEPGGRLYFSVPIGPSRIEFNAHRVFSLEQLLRLVEGTYDISRFSYVDDEGHLHRDPAMEPNAIATSFGCWFGCGILELVKRQEPRI